MPSLTDRIEQLFPRAQAGDHEAFADLVQLTEDVVRGLVARFRFQAADREDVETQVYVEAWKGLRHVRDPAGFLPWLYRITIRTAFRWRRSLRQRNGREILGEDLDATPQDPVGDGDGSAWVRDVLESLPEEYRRVFDQKFLQQMTTEEIARASRRQAHQISYLLKRGKEILRWRMGNP